MDYKAFVEADKSLLIAPAGYGKTFTIVECLKHTTGKQLVLTHTHAGIAAIKEKIKKAPEIKSSQYCIETISSFAQKYVKAFYVGEEMPDQELSKDYHKFVIDQAVHVFRASPVQNILEASYAGLFVDEYQDCNINQHNMILEISNVLPTHILGDYLQGIFEFSSGDSLVDFDEDLNDFERFPDIETPHRWYQKGNNSSLGDHLKIIRELLENNLDITLVANNDIGFHVQVVKSGDIRLPNSTYRKGLKKLIDNPENKPEYENLLIIAPTYEGGGNIHQRVNIRPQVDPQKKLVLLEAIDASDFYAVAKNADDLISNLVNSETPIHKCKELLLKFFNKTDLDKWINGNNLKQKEDKNNKIRSQIFQEHIETFVENPNVALLQTVFNSTKTDLKCKFKREELLYSFLKALKQAQLGKISIYEAMIEQRNMIRRSGRKIKGKCLGTTLLTKGLEFDTVAILDAHNFDSPKHLYVALTRACKKLVIFTENTTLSPYADVG
jgi:hypothetical protein